MVRIQHSRYVYLVHHQIFDFKVELAFISDSKYLTMTEI